MNKMMQDTAVTEISASNLLLLGGVTYEALGIWKEYN